MSDKLERDVEEVLKGIEDFDWRRRERRPGPLRRAARRFGHKLSERLAAFSSGHLMLVSSLFVIAGFILRVSGPGKWAVIIGVILFLIGLVWTLRSGGGQAAGGPRGGYWRDRYVSYDPPPRNPLSRWFRRRSR